MLRWLSGSLMLVACLSLACLSSITGLGLAPLSVSDSSSGWVRMASCGATQPTAVASASRVLQPPHGLGVANASLAIIVPAADRQLALAVASSRPPTGCPTDRSLTYLRTARLRL